MPGRAQCLVIQFLHKQLQAMLPVPQEACWYTTQVLCQVSACPSLAAGDAVKPADLRNGMLPDSEAHKQHADPEAGNGARPQLQHILTQESRQVPPLKLGVLVVMFAGGAPSSLTSLHALSLRQ